MLAGTILRTQTSRFATFYGEAEAEAAAHAIAIDDEEAVPTPKTCCGSCCEKFGTCIKKVAGHPFVLAVIALLSWSASMYLVGQPAEDLDIVEIICTYFMGDATGAMLGAIFAAIKLKQQALPVKMSVKKNAWSTYVIAVLFPILSIGS